MDKKAEIYGMFCALQVAIRALSKTHPQPEKLIEALRHEHEESLALLNASPIPDQSIAAYRDFLGGMIPNPDDIL